MFKIAHRLAWLLTFAMWLHATYFWAGVGLTANVGPWVLHESQRSFESLGIAFYAHPDKQMFGLAGGDGAVAYAESQLGHVYKDPDDSGTRAPRTVYEAMPEMLKLSHRGAPIALIVALILFWRR